MTAGSRDPNGHRAEAGGAGQDAELLAALGAASELAEAGRVLLAHLSAAAGAPRAALFALDEAGRQLELRATHGYGVGDAASARLPRGAAGHPLVMSTLALASIRGEGTTLDDGAVPFGAWVLIPLPRARDVHDSDEDVDGAELEGLAPRFATSRVVRAPHQAPTRAERAPFGVVALEARLDEATIDALALTAARAGPLVERAAMLDRLRRSAERLDEQRSLLTAVINALPDPIVISDARNAIVAQNRRAEQLLAAHEEDSEGRRRAVEINGLLFGTFLAKASRGGGTRPVARELNLVDPDEGADLLFEVLVRPLPPGFAREGAFITVLRDVTDLRRASIELERQFARTRVTEMEATRERDRLNLILRNAGDPIIVTDDEGRITLLNPPAEQLFDLPAADGGDGAARAGENDAQFSTLVADFALSPASFRRERVTLVQPRTGAEIPMEVVAGKILDEHGQVRGIVSVLHDLTRQAENERLNQELTTLNAELEDRIRLATTDLEQQNLQLQWQSRELEKAYRLKSEFLANMSHELRTPINALIGYAALMLDRIYGELTPKQAEGLGRIQASSQHLLALISDILDLSKIEAGKMPVHLEPTPIRPILREVAAQVEPQVRHKDIEFRLEVADDIPVLYTDRVKVKQIVLNLLSNAVKFTHQGRVLLRARRAGPSLELVVSDTGIGIRREHLHMIFEEFRQVDQSRTREYGGTGLGLSITRKLIALLGGNIVVDSEYGRGTMFHVTLPLRSEPGSVEEQVARAAIGQATRPSS